MAFPNGKLTGDKPKLSGRPWHDVARNLENWVNAAWTQGNSMVEQLTIIFSTPGGALQGLLNAAGQLLGHDGTNTVAIPPGGDGTLLGADSTVAEGVRYRDPDEETLVLSHQVFGRR